MLAFPLRLPFIAAIFITEFVILKFNILCLNNFYFNRFRLFYNSIITQL